MSLKNHYVALVVTKSNTKPDTFCKEHQLELSLGGNHFSSCKSPIFGQDSTQEECIPVGCIPPTAAAVQSAPGGDQGLHQAPPLGADPLGPGSPQTSHPPPPLGAGTPTPRSRPA